MKKLCIFLFVVLFYSCERKKATVQQQAKVVTKDTVKTPIAFNEAALDTLVNNENFIVIGEKNAIVKIVDSAAVDSFPDFKTFYTDGKVAVLGKNVAYDYLDILKKYHPTTSFEDYKVTVFKGALADPDFSSNTDAKMFKTRIVEGCQDGINFAGHYTLVLWGCGTSCQSFVIVDRKTGKIYNGFTTTLGLSYQDNSAMLVKNVGAIATDTNLIATCAYCDVENIVWTGTAFKKVD
ncbi:hypothetical protein ACG2LH_11325 [Zhouia sp. PK063]|uniref:hypothetical protein n=1 Tax=Zhouia sp. PK063 TaxID=3373602 RepID=UPI0037BC80E0